MIQTDLALGSALLFYLLLAAFCWPAVLGLTLWDREGRLAAGTRIGLGLAVAFGTFSAFSGPLLIAHCPSSWARLGAITAWSVAAVGLGIVAARQRQGGRKTLLGGWRLPHRSIEESAGRERLEGDASAAPEADKISSGDAVCSTDDLPLYVPRDRFWGVMIAVMLVVTAVVAWIFATERVPRRAGSLLAVTALFANAAVAWFARRSARPMELEDRTGLRWLTFKAKAVAAALGVFLLVTTVSYVREDTDDTLYLSEALLLRDSPAMGAEEPAHRGEGLPANILYTWQSFELWGAQLSYLAGVHTIIAFRTLLAPVLVVVSILLVVELFRRFLPHGTWPVALLVFLAYLTFGMSSHWTANNYLLPRPSQGKTWLVHLVVPALIIMVDEFMRQPRQSTWWLLLACSFAGLGAAPTGVYLVPALLGPLLLAHCVSARSGHAWRTAAAAMLVVFPQVLFALYLKVNEEALIKELTLSWSSGSRWRDAFLFKHLNLSQGGGALELCCLLLLPYLPIFYPRRRQLIYPFGFVVLFFATVANPWAFPLVAGYVTGGEGYQRLFWLVPFGIILGAVTAALYCMTATGNFPRVAGAAVLGMGLLLPSLLGGKYVWSRANVYFSERMTQETIYRARNAYKMPSELLAIGRLLMQLPVGPGERILCSSRCASHLSPLAPEFDFVFTTQYRTRASLLMLGRNREADIRERLARDFLNGRMDAEQAVPFLEETLTWYVVLERARPAVETVLKSAGFSQTARFGEYRLFARVRSSESTDPTDENPSLR